jgi:hypothetical protein
VRFKASRRPRLAARPAGPDLGLDPRAPGGTLGRILLLFAVLAVGYDAVASALVLATGWSYAALAVGALAIQVAAGFVAGRRAGFLTAILAGAGTALAEGTLGFGAAWLIGPGRTHLPATLDYLGALVRAVVAGGALGGAGGAAALGWSVGGAEAAGAGRVRWGVLAALRVPRLDRFLARVLLERGVGLWVGVRALYALGGAAGGASPIQMLGPQPGMPILLALLALADLARRHEYVLFADLGLGAARAVALYVLPGALLEAALLLVPR